MLVLIAGDALLLWIACSPPASAINRRNAERVAQGMMLPEVEALLGGPSRDESGFDAIGVRLNCGYPDFADSSGGVYLATRRKETNLDSLDGIEMLFPLGQTGRWMLWRSRTMQVGVLLNDDRRVVKVIYNPIRRDWKYDQSWQGRIRCLVQNWVGD